MFFSNLYFSSNMKDVLMYCHGSHYWILCAVKLSETCNEVCLEISFIMFHKNPNTRIQANPNLPLYLTMFTVSLPPPLPHTHTQFTWCNEDGILATQVWQLLKVKTLAKERALWQLEPLKHLSFNTLQIWHKLISIMINEPNPTVRLAKKWFKRKCWVSLIV